MFNILTATTPSMNMEQDDDGITDAERKLCKGIRTLTSERNNRQLELSELLSQPSPDLTQLKKRTAVEMKIIKYDNALLQIGPCSIHGCQKHHDIRSSSTTPDSLLREILSDTDEDEQPPPKKAAISDNEKVTTIINIPTDNPFDPIMEIEQDNPKDGEQPKEVAPHYNGLEIHFETSPNYQDILAKLHATFPKLHTSLAGKYIRISTLNQGHFEEVKGFVQEMNIEFITRTPRHMIPSKFVIKGLPTITNPKDIHLALTEMDYAIVQVSQLHKQRSKTKLPIFQILLHTKDNHKDIKELKRLLYMVVNVEKFNKRTGPTICYNCNRSGHSSMNCHSKARCFKCGLEHQSRDCPLTGKITKPVCINCKGEGHLSIWSGCPLYPRKPTFPRATTTSGKSFADAARSTTTKDKKKAEDISTKPKQDPQKDLKIDIQELRNDLQALQETVNSLTEVFGGHSNLKAFITHINSTESPKDTLRKMCKAVGLTINP